MPAIDAHDPGTICWIDLASTDADGATEFYCELFGWTAEIREGHLQDVCWL